MKHSIKVHHDFITSNSLMLLSSLLCLILMSALGCKEKSSDQKKVKQTAKGDTKKQSTQSQAEDESLCTKVGTRCQLRPGVLGVCTPSTPNTALGWVPPLLVCTPQH